MSPARRPPRGNARGWGGGRGKRKGRGVAAVAFAFLVIVAAGAAALAVYFGFVPGPGSLLGKRAEAPADDSTLASSIAVTDTAPAGAPPIDSTVAAATDSTTLVAATNGTVSVTDSAAGDAVYHGTGRCVGCHGAAGEGAGALGPALRDGSRAGLSTVAAIGRVVASGGASPPAGGFRIAMPSYAGQLGPTDIARVAAYVYALAHPGHTAPDSSTTPAMSDAAGGAVNADAPIGGAVRRPTVPAPAPSAIRPTVPAPPTPAGRRP